MYSWFKFSQSFSNMGINNQNNTLFLNNFIVTVSRDPPLLGTMHFKTTWKCTIPPRKSMLISTVVNGSALSAFRPLTELQTLIDGHQAFEDHLALKVVPALHSIRHPDSTAFTRIVNNSHASKTLGKGTYIANGNKRSWGPFS